MSSTDQTERAGVEAIRAKIARLGWFVREPVRPDYGIDLFVETEKDGRPTGRLLALQVKSGSSYVGEANSNITLRVQQSHMDYWRDHSLPVVVVLYEPETDQAFWQAVTESTAESTGKGWNLTVPRSQVLDADALPPLAALAAPEASHHPSREEKELSQLRADLTWMRILESGGSVRIDVDEWINKTSGRADLLLTAQPAGSDDEIERGFTVFLGLRPYTEALPDLFPWADLHSDEALLEQHDEEEWMTETGIWDSEEKRYIGNSQTFKEWLAARPPDGDLRPYSNSAGEVDHWRLSARLNDVGRGFLALERHLSP